MKYVAILLAFFACFWWPSPDDPDRIPIYGQPEHFEGWYDDNGIEQQYVWIDGVEYLVYQRDLIIFYYDDEEESVLNDICD